MKRSPLLPLALLAVGLAFATTGCFTTRRATAAANRVPTYALVVSVNGGQPPTDAQWAVLQKQFAATLAARGLILITDPTFADKLIHVQFYPDNDDPTTGSVYVVGVRNNPASSISVATATRTIPASYSYSSSYRYASGMNYPYGNYYPEYYGYFNDYGPAYAQPVAVTKPGRPPPPNHPGTHHTTRPIDCPPDAPGHPAPGYAGNHPKRPNPPPADGGHWWSRPRSEPSYSSSSSNNSSPVYSSPSPSNSSSYSAPSISMSSSSSSSSSSPVYSSPSPSSSSSYSAPSISMSSSSSSSSTSSSSSSSSSGNPNEQPR